VAQSDTRYDLVIAELSQDLETGLLGSLSWNVTSGRFLSTDNVPFMDRYHFLGNRTWFPRPSSDGFSLLPYYRFSTTDAFVEVHAEHHFGGFWLNKIPGLRQLKLRELVGVNSFYTQEVGALAEGVIGIENVFKVLRIDYAWALTGQNFPQRQGIRFRLAIG
jgi:hypothetical protein